ncbi:MULTISPECIES: TonB-dependent receptor [Chryseobacterium]|uniref:Iron complex outermembrane receptor protein n=1 Tax=Chryseobacterium camelliae TaxID=1265445 RepID=A0ABU0TMQ5_9FLAO|nr:MULTISPECIES: TonB-dependent receptor [Chryseobacterium]MDT3407829.1 iron complex outermembrane receptor protein [Pseudacidovorax intermedius]MDQ1098317.1 iron complex outermembrane receptor protein [Chryseobacterium camelliae]MDQ1102241.1 iron complex outermembrane receptor protein [Chryseobacterium sp. SORGH_AS_1048]MDR6085679.1 iron complex outermembrane receptor protein [Chryseobacterium sp. SORGH_AS_0909]MDR6130046.1 iron complex outermembrane receptor protein [Chryseobacterium sp. SOR
MKKTFTAISFLAATMAFAQSNDSLKVNNVDEVVMTASRKKESIKEIPSSVTIVGEKQIQSQLTINSDISNILQYTVPSLATSSGTTTNSGQTLRGRQVLVLIDGIPQSTPLRNGARDIRSIDPSVIERIEVIKGASSIYGNGADGGIINYITRRSRTNQKISGISQIGITGQPYGGTLGIRATQLLSGKLSDKFDYVASLTYERTGYMKDADGVYLSPTYSTAKMDNYNGLLKLGYNINQNQRIEASYIGYASKSDLDLGLKTGKYGITPTIADGAGKNLATTPQGTPRNHNYKLSYDNKNLFWNTALNVNLYYQDFRTVYGYSDTFLNGGQSNVISKKSGLRANLDTQLWNTQNSQGEVIYGLDVLNDKTAQKLEDGRYWTPDMDMTNIAPFLMVKVDLLKKLTLKGGLRYENIKVKVSDFNTLSTIKNDGTFTKSIFVKGGDLEYNALVGNIGLRYNIQPYLNLFASFSQSYSINELGRILRTSTSETIANLEAKPIIVNNYELGATGQIAKWLNYEMTSYVSTSKLGASFVQSPDRSLTIQRAPEIVYGVEGYLNFTPLRWLNFGGSYSWMEGLTSLNDNGDYSAKINNSRISAPKVLAYVQLRPVQALSIGIDMLHGFRQNRFDPNPKTGLYSYGEGTVPDYTVFNFRSSYDLNSNWKLSLGIENVFNKVYQPAIAWWAARDSDFVNALGMRGTFMVEYRF